MVGVLTVQVSAPLLHREHPPPVLFPGLNVLVMRGSHGVKLPFPVLQLGHQQLELSSLPLDGGAARVVRRELSQRDTRVTHARPTLQTLPFTRHLDLRPQTMDGGLLGVIGAPT